MKQKARLSLVEALEQVYGKASSAGFGSAVFYEISTPGTSLASIALNNYKQFLGDKWTGERETAWMNAWKLVYERSPGKVSDILSELNSIKDADGKRSVPLFTELVENAEQGKISLSALYNHPDMALLQVFSVGDGEAMSGLLLSGLFEDHSACSVICLMD